MSENKVCALFSGQGSQYPGMGKELYENVEAARRVYECAGDILGFDVAKISFEGDEQELSRTLVAQPVIYTHSMACLAAAGEVLGRPHAVAGHSLGEFAALTCAGAMGLEEGLRVIKARSQAMDQASGAAAGAMYAIVGSDEETVRTACEQAQGFVAPVNFNLPGQTVLSGEAAAAASAAAALEQQGAKAVRLAVSSAFHTPMMEGAARQFAREIQGIAFQAPTVDFYSNLTGDKLEPENYPEYFAEHMVRPVRFVEQARAMERDGIQVCVELGPKKTVCTLAKKNVRAFQVCNVEDLKTLEKAAKLLA